MTPESDQPSPLTWIRRYGADLFAVGIGLAALVLSCVGRSHRVPMWLDELYSYNLLQDPSLSHLLKALGDGADGGLPLYYALAYAWTALFSLDELSLRLFTTAAVWAALVLVWMTLRKTFRFWPTVIAVSLVFGTSNTIRFENANVRFYGLLLAAVALALLSAVELGVRERPGRRMLAANAAAQACLVFSHPVGGFYGLALCLGTVFADGWVYRRFRWSVILSYPAGWLTLGLWGPQLLRQADINQPRSWIPVPGWRDLATVNGAVAGDLERLGLFLGLAWAAAFLIGQRASGAAALPVERLRDEAARRRNRVVALGCTLVGVLPLVWIFSRWVPTNSLFVARYLIGVSVGWTILLAQLASMVLARYDAGPRSVRLPLKALVLAFALWNGAMLCGNTKPDRVGWLGFSDVAFGHEELPIVCQRALEYLPRNHYSPQAERYCYLLDWSAATTADNHFAAAGPEQKVLAGIGRNYGELYHHNIVDAGEFLRECPAFLIQDDPQTHWIANRLKREEYTITRLTPAGPMAALARRTYPMLLVERKAGKGEVAAPVNLSAAAR